MRERAVAKKAPAEPTTARMAVGFSGESAQPACACSGRVTESRRTKPRNMRVDLFIDGLQVGKVWTQKSICQRRKNTVSVVPSSVVRKKTVIWYIRGISNGDGFRLDFVNLLSICLKRREPLHFFCDSHSYFFR
jgi:hypothetical protein